MIKQINIFFIYYVSPSLQEYPPKFGQLTSYAESLHLFAQIALIKILYNKSNQIVGYIFQAASFCSVILLLADWHLMFTLVLL